MKERRRVLIESGMPKSTFQKRSLCRHHEQVFRTRMRKSAFSCRVDWWTRDWRRFDRDSLRWAMRLEKPLAAQSSQCAE